MLRMIILPTARRLLGKAGLGGARLGSAGLGKAGHGTDKARRTGAVGAAVFLATHGYARPARHGLAWQGEASKDRVEIEWIGRKVLRLA